MAQEVFKLAHAMRDRLCSRMLKQAARNNEVPTEIAIPTISSLQTFRQQNYTVVLLNGDIVGVSKRMPTDPQNSTTGVNKALYRAVRRLVTTSQR